MDIELKVELRKAIEKWSDKIIEHPKTDAALWTDKLVENMTDAAINIYDQNLETQKWLKEQGYLEY